MAGAESRKRVGRTRERQMTVVPEALRISQEERMMRPVIDCGLCSVDGVVG